MEETTVIGTLEESPQLLKIPVPQAALALILANGTASAVGIVGLGIVVWRLD
jgi:hypothetical protein